MKDGLDDFRDGLPPVVQGSDFIKASTNENDNLHKISILIFY